MSTSGNIRVTTPDIVSKALRMLHDSYGYTWRELASKPELAGVPAGTLCTIAKHGTIPKRHRERFKQRKYRDLFAMPADMLRLALNNREEL